MIDPHKCATLSSDAMASAKKYAEQAKAIEDSCYAASSWDLTKLMSMTDTFTCGKCGQKKCCYYQKQTRSADEPMVRSLRAWTSAQMSSQALGSALWSLPCSLHPAIFPSLPSLRPADIAVAPADDICNLCSVRQSMALLLTGGSVAGFHSRPSP